jgi:hypothetical protein
MEEHFWKPLASSVRRIATIVTADHGMTSIDPTTTVYMNRHWPNIQESLQVNQKGMPLVPAGSCRDFFLHVKQEKLAEMQAYLSLQLQGKAEVFFVHDLIDKGFFGMLPPSKRFLERVGNLVIIPYENESIWWYEKRHFEQNFYAAHGGLTPNEMESIFLFSTLN